jgi:hypothetical protein
LRPNEFWDIAKEGEVDRIPIRKPDFESLTEKDLVLITLMKPENVAQALSKLEKGPARYLLSANWHDYVCRWAFEGK